jgi:predicted ester cyclase
MTAPRPTEAASAPPSGPHLSPRQVAAAFYASYNADLAAGFERYIAEDLLLHGFDGPDERSAWVAGDLELKASLTGYRLEVLDQIAEGDKVATRWLLGGHHTGRFLDFPPTGRHASFAATTVDRVEDGKIIEHWSDADFTAFLQKLAA